MLHFLQHDRNYLSPNREDTKLIIQFQQPFGRIDDNPARREVNLNANVLRKRNQQLLALTAPVA